MKAKTLSAVAIIAILGLSGCSGNSDDACADKLAKEEFETILSRGPWNAVTAYNGVKFRTCKALVGYWDDRPQKKQTVAFLHDVAHRKIYQMRYDDEYNFLNGGAVDMAARELSAARGFVVQEGRYKGRAVGDLSIAYIRAAPETKG